jgi:hypothetical protein
MNQFAVAVVDSIVLQQPVNTAVVQGSDVRFECGANETNKIRLNYYRLGSTTPIAVWSGEQMSDDLKAERFFAEYVTCRNTATCYIGITAVSIKTAGYIVCHEVGKPVKYAASLVVLGELISFLAAAAVDASELTAK